MNPFLFHKVCSSSTSALSRLGWPFRELFGSTSFHFRFNCFLCDYDLCKACVKGLESANIVKIKENPVFDKEEKQCQEDVKNTAVRQGSILLDNDDDIPLIDSQEEMEDIPVENEIPSFMCKQDKAVSISKVVRIQSLALLTFVDFIFVDLEFLCCYLS